VIACPNGLEQALYNADAANQEAIFDLGEFNDIDTAEGIAKLKQAGTYSAEAHDVARRNARALAEGFSRARDRGETGSTRANAGHRGSDERGGYGHSEGYAGEEFKTPWVEADGTVKLHHWSHVAGTGTTDPEKYGTDIAGEEARRKRTCPEVWSNRTYLGMNVGRPGGYRYGGENYYGVDSRRLTSPHDRVSITFGMYAEWG
jgi:hypothetical protein